MSRSRSKIIRTAHSTWLRSVSETRTATETAGSPTAGIPRKFRSPGVVTDSALVGGVRERLSVESPAVEDFPKALQSSGLSVPSLNSPRLSIDPENARNGLAQLVLTLIKLLHELLERQAMRRVDSGSLTKPQIERLGITLMRQGEEIERLRKELGFKEEDLNIDLGPLGKLV